MQRFDPLVGEPEYIEIEAARKETADLVIE